MEGIAVVGIGCRYPDATGPEELWQNVLGRRRAFRALPGERLAAGYRGGPHEPDLTYVDRAALLRDWEFDRSRFGVPGALHRAADHTHWLALETAAAALADAARPDGDGLDRATTGVIIGNSLTGEFTRAGTLRTRWPFVRDAAATALHRSGVADDVAAEVVSRLAELVKSPFPVPGDESLAGALSNTIAGRICNHFDFHGTGYTVDGACSSSLLAVMAACRALSTGELDFALAGGVDLSLDPFELVGFARLGALATDRMRIYDRAPTGFLPGEGCGIVALARAADAERLGMRVYARVAGWGSSSDGAGGLTRPAEHGQALALRRAYRMAGIRPDAVEMVEGHGTGTAVGDAVELAALTEVRGAGAAKAALGSVKANIGHTKAAAGVAGLIKAALAAHHGVLPPTTGCEAPHELLDRATTPLRVLTGAQPWDSPKRLAAVSSMGFGGINAHVVLEAGGGRTRRRMPPEVLQWSAPLPEHEIVLVAGRDETELAHRLDVLAPIAERLSDAELHDLAATQRQEVGAVRAALVADHPAALADAARAARRGLRGWDRRLGFDEQAGYALGADEIRVGLLFPGQAAPVRTELPGWAARMLVPDLPAVDESEVDTRLAQPAIVRQSLAGLAWLNRLDCRATAVAGHSLGEISALVWAGAFTAGAGLRFAAERGRIMAEHGTPDSGMAGLTATAEQAERLLDGTAAVIAGYNGPEQIVISGPTPDVLAVVRRAAEHGIAATRLPVSHGFHSPAMLGAVEPLRRALRDFEFDALAGTVLSTITGAELPAGAAIPELLVEQLTRPVRFTAALERLAARCDLLVETGPGTILSGLARSATAIPAISLDCGGPARRHAFATAVLAAGGAADLGPWFADRRFRTVRADAMPRLLANPCEQPADRVEGAVLAAVSIETAVLGAPPEHPQLPAEPLPALIEHLAAQLELPAESIGPGSSLLGDLHLNSLQVVQIVGRVAGALGKRPPNSPLSLADATVGEAAAVLAELDADTADGDAEAPAGVRGWVRAFAAARLPVAPAEGGGLRWSVRAPAGHWLLDHHDDGAGNLAVVLDEPLPRSGIAALLRDIAKTAPDRLLIVHSGHEAAAAIGRSVAAELHPDWVGVVGLDEPGTRFDPDRLPIRDDYAELHVDAAGGITRTALRHRELVGGQPLPLQRGDVCLVTGGVRGITAHSALALAERTGCTLVLLGRTAADDPEISAAVRDIRTRVDAHYLSCDVADRAAVAAMAAAASAHGPVRGLLHGAGVNEPRRLADVTGESLAATMRPKVDGLEALLSACEDLRLVVGYGSIIGRFGLPGQAEYCLANDVLRHRLEAWAAPDRRVHLLEWSLWSGIGMGVDLGVLESLRAQGVVPIGPEQGNSALLDVLATPDAPVSLLVTSRFPAMPTASFGTGPEPLLRFDEDRLTRTPGVEAVSDAHLSPGADRYLDDHRIACTPILPAVLGLEAMAQVASVAGADCARSFTDVELREPIAVDDEATIRIAALTGGGGAEAVIREARDGFRADKFTARITAAPSEPAAIHAAEPPEQAQPPHPYYGKILFHSGRFRRLLRYDVLSAFRVRAWIQATDQDWFSEFHSGDLLLGDPGAHDAALHVLLACVPHRLALPTGVDRMTVWREPRGPLRVIADEREHTADTYCFDVDVVDPGGAAVARWEGLRLRATGEHRASELPLRLAGPWLSRRLVETGLADGIELITAVGARGDAAGLLTRVLGAPAGHDPRGALHVPGGHASAAYTGGCLLLGVAGTPIGLDWQRISPTEPIRPAVLERVDRGLVDEVADKVGEDPAAAAARVWTAREAVVKLGHEQGHPLNIDHVTEDGLVVVRAGQVRVVIARAPIDELGDAALAVAVPAE
ncbi:enediyne polyketide synthase [Saccharopolyspora shandongensis]|uniref:Enediyne polyketide synthase n=1 Tax=Saccharopolyspora shandongensis TaxID=418495 RepID=A0A1H2QN46_9PSEU|nr:type I polyketide synthase [Saccharopolyspora shandongensis]SDW08623.1 enediyne polyketide synthase [Saccharopolyspora shandongensis]